MVRNIRNTSTCYYIWIYSTGLEKVYHGDRDGKIYNHNTGNSFNGANIEAEYQSPDYDYGDLGTLKNFRLC